MPFVQPTANALIPAIFNVSRAVGLNSPNEHGDVRLVQYMLSAIYQSASIPKPPGTLAVDGFYGPTTQRWISQFQRDSIAVGNPILPDGRVDRAKGGPLSSVSHTIYTIVAMNLTLRSLNPAAFAATPLVVPMSPPGQIPPEYSNAQPVPATGGL